MFDKKLMLQKVKWFQCYHMLTELGKLEEIH